MKKRKNYTQLPVWRRKMNIPMLIWMLIRPRRLLLLLLTTITWIICQVTQFVVILIWPKYCPLASGSWVGYRVGRKIWLANCWDREICFEWVDFFNLSFRPSHYCHLQLLLQEANWFSDWLFEVQSVLLSPFHTASFWTLWRERGNQ